MARTGLINAGFALSAALMLVASCDQPPDCKTSPGGCASASAVKTIAPSKPETIADTPIVPTPRPEPASGGRKIQSARHARHGGSLTRNSPSYRYDNSRSISGSAHDAYSGQMSGTGCDEACRYRAWLEDYDAWYRTYGQRYAEYPPAPSASNRDWPRTAYRSGEARTRSEWDRLDPWHGYDGHDGPQNGY